MQPNQPPPPPSIPPPPGYPPPPPSMPPAGYPPQLNQPAGDKQGKNGFAVAGFVLSFFGVLGFLGLIFCIIALGKAKERNGAGKKLAVAGLIISPISIVWGIANLVNFANADGFTAFWM